MAFIPKGSLVPFGGPVLRSEIITNSITVVVLDSVKVTTGFIALGTAGAAVFGHVNAISTNFGVGLTSSGAAGATAGSFVDRYLTTSTNQTVEKVRAVIDVSQFTLYSADLSATEGTTTGSNLLGYRMNLSDPRTLDESSAATSIKQYGTFGLDQGDLTNTMVNILQSSVFNT